MASRGTKRLQPLLAGVDGSYEDRDSELLCPICLETMADPYVTVCGHSFCHGCIVKSFDLTNKCPKCSLTFENRQCIFPNTVLNTLVTKQRKLARARLDDDDLRQHQTVRDFGVLVQRDLKPCELNYMLEVLQRKRAELEAQRQVFESRLLHEFLDHLHTKKKNELENLRTELELLDSDLKTVRQKLAEEPSTSASSLKKESTGSGQVATTTGSSSGAGEEAAFNASCSRVPLSFSQQRVRMHDHFDDLESKYWTLRNCAVGGDGGRDAESLRDFQHILNQMTRYSSLRPLANLSYGNDLLNTANIVSSIEFDKDCDFFAIAGVTKRIKVYDYAAVVRDVIDLHYPVMEMVANSKISCVSWSSYHKSVLCSSDYEGHVSIWDASVGTRMRVFQEHEKRCWSVDFNRVDSHLIASGSDDSRVKIWSLNAEHSVATLEAKANVCCVKFNPASRYHLAYGAADHCVHYVDLRQPKEPLRVFKGHRKAVSYVKFIDEKHLVSASTDSQLKLWSTDDSVSLRSFKGHTNEKNFVGLSNNQDFIACGSENNALYVYCRGLSQPLLHYKFDVVKSVLDKERQDEDSAEFISAVCWKPQSNVIIAANSQGTIKLLELVWPTPHPACRVHTPFPVVWKRATNTADAIHSFSTSNVCPVRCCASSEK